MRQLELFANTERAAFDMANLAELREEYAADQRHPVWNRRTWQELIDERVFLGEITEDQAQAWRMM